MMSFTVSCPSLPNPLRVDDKRVKALTTTIQSFVFSDESNPSAISSKLKILASSNTRKHFAYAALLIITEVLNEIENGARTWNTENTSKILIILYYMDSSYLLLPSFANMPLLHYLLEKPKLFNKDIVVVLMKLCPALLIRGAKEGDESTCPIFSIFSQEDVDFDIVYGAICLHKTTARLRSARNQSVLQLFILASEATYCPENLSLAILSLLLENCPSAAFETSITQIRRFVIHTDEASVERRSVINETKQWTPLDRMIDWQCDKITALCRLHHWKYYMHHTRKEIMISNIKH